MYEVRGARQPRVASGRQGFRRIFANADYTLHVWYDRRDGAITELHLLFGPYRQRRISCVPPGADGREGPANERGHWGRDKLELPAAFDLADFREAITGIDAGVRDAILDCLTQRV